MFYLDARAARATWTVMALALLVALVYVLRHVLLLLVFSTFVAYLISPIVHQVQRWRPFMHRRALAIGVVYLLLGLAVVATGIGLGPRLTRELAGFAEKVPEMSRQLRSGEILSPVLRTRGWEYARIREVEIAVGSHAQQIIDYTQQAIASLLQWLVGAWVVVLVPIFAFFILRDAEGVMAAIGGQIEDPPQRQLLREISDDVHRLLGDYVRALILLALLTFAVWSGAFLVAGVPYGIVLAAIAGGLEFIPLLGPLAAGVIVVSVALFSGYPHPWLLIAFILVWRGVQDYVASPLIMGRGVEVHAAVVVLGVIVGGEIGGPAGMFLSIPVIAALRIVWRRGRALRGTGARVVRARSGHSD